MNIDDDDKRSDTTLVSEVKNYNQKLQAHYCHNNQYNAKHSNGLL
jgi:hypothetical protein